MIAFVLAAALSVPAKASDAAALYQTRCSSCHGLQMQGGPQAPPLVNVDAADVDFMLQTGRMPAERPWEEEVRKPPSFTHLQIAGLVAYIMSKSSGDQSLPAIHTGGDLRAGRVVFQENCAQCHSATGKGNNVGYRNVAPSMMDSTPLEIAEAVRTGPDVMPKFGPNVIDQRHLDDLLAYVHWLQTANYNAGGFALSNWGPISEGFIAWAIGMAVLVLLVRRLGSTE
ncbi:MAG TPA: c-type cytochrome [Candidatus Rubrimentiphilum sp.]|nr:c-type cytochrome [Candidatus Rubrimentiphilum sp.]